MKQRPNLNSQIVDEASFWFVESRAEKLDEQRRMQFDAWLRRSPEHLRAYLEIAAIWSETPTLNLNKKWDIDALIAEAAKDADNVVALNDHDPDATESHASQPDSEVHDHFRKDQRFAHIRGRRAFALAACLAGFVVLAGWLWFQLRYPIYTTGVGEQHSLKLADSSTVDMNSRSRLRIRYSKGERAVDLLAGQALFRVAKDPTRPFIVMVGATRVRAVGTQFDIYRKQRVDVVTVVEGRVSVIPRAEDTAEPRSHAEATNMGGPTLVSAGEQLTVTSRGLRLSDHPDIDAATAWTQRRIVFDSATLSEVAEEFNRYNSRRLVIVTPELYRFHISGVFSTDPQSLIRFLHERRDLRVIETRSEIRIVKNDS
jgi:transmembrane sensor